MSNKRADYFVTILLTSVVWLAVLAITMPDAAKLQSAHDKDMEFMTEQIRECI